MEHVVRDVYCSEGQLLAPKELSLRKHCNMVSLRQNISFWLLAQKSKNKGNQKRLLAFLVCQ